MMKLFLVVMALGLNPFFVFGQGVAFNLGYQYLGKHTAFLGGDLRLSDEYASPFNIGAGAYLLQIDERFTAIPELHSNYTWNNVFLGEFSISPKNIKPSIGFNLLNMAHLKLGYSFPLASQEEFRSFSFGVNFYLGTKGFYDYLKLSF
jgi:hypothetical protein